MFRCVICVCLALFLPLLSTACQESTPHRSLGMKKWIFQDTLRDVEIVSALFYPTSLPPTQVSETDIWKRERAHLEAPFDVSKKRPLILLSPGNKGSYGDHGWLIETLVHQGYLVLAFRHCDGQDESMPSLEIWNRPLDISYALTKFLLSPYGEAVDQERIGFVGFSLGGFTGIWLSGGVSDRFNASSFWPTQEYVHPDYDYPYAKVLEEVSEFSRYNMSYRDPRIRAFFLMAPSWSWVFDETGLEKIHSPVCITAGDCDERLVTHNNAMRYAAYIPGAQFHSLPSLCGHYVFLNEIHPEAIPYFDPHQTRTHLYQDDPSVCRQEVHERVSDLALDFFRKHLICENTPL